MPDREKVIKGLECCITFGQDSCKKCYQERPGVWDCLHTRFDAGRAGTAEGAGTACADAGRSA